MDDIGVFNGAFGADTFGFRNLKRVNWNLEAPSLYEHALQRGEAQLAAGGALVAETGIHTGRSPKDKFVVRSPETENEVWWDNNGAISQAQFDTLYEDFLAHARARSCTPRTSTAVPTRRTASGPGSTPSMPGTRCSSATC